MTSNLAECYRILDLSPDATQEEVKRAYRELAKVWHPDRFTGDPKLQQKAQEKLKQINSAYERICKSGPHERQNAGSTRGGPSPGSRASTDANERKDSTTDRGEGREEAPRQPPPPPPQPTPATATNWGRRVLQFVIAIVILSVVRGIFTSSDRSPRQTPDYRPSYSTPSRSYSPEPPAARHASESSQRLTLSKPPAEDTQSLEPPPPSGLADNTPRGYFTVGSTKDEVLSVQGTPKRMNDNEFTYEYSTVRFRNGRVESWNDISSVLKARMLPSVSVEAKSYFTVGSTKDEVLSVQGTPKRMNDNEFTYEYSTVRFRDGRVESWNDISNVLKVR